MNLDEKQFLIQYFVLMDSSNMVLPRIVLVVASPVPLARMQ